jgi:RNA polymerase sigma factor (sigma-70 family)
MSDNNWASLRRHFLANYKELGKWLTHRLGSADFAADVLHDTYMRLERGGELGSVDNPNAYLQRMAVNIAHNAKRYDKRQLTPLEAEVFFDHAMDEAPNAARIVAARQAVGAIRAVLQTMPPLRRKIFLAAWVDDTPHAEIAKRLGLSMRRVQKESQKAREEVRRVLRKKIGD